jgi:hypothetical protein
MGIQGWEGVTTSANLAPRTGGSVCVDHEVQLRARESGRPGARGPSIGGATTCEINDLQGSEPRGAPRQDVAGDKKVADGIRTRDLSDHHLDQKPFLRRWRSPCEVKVLSQALPNTCRSVPGAVERRLGAAPSELTDLALQGRKRPRDEGPDGKPMLSPRSHTRPARPHTGRESR